MSDSILGDVRQAVRALGKRPAFSLLVIVTLGLLAHVTPSEVRETYKMWFFSEFGAVSWAQLRVLVPAVLVSLAVAWSLAKPLNALLLGETYARSVGEHVVRTRLLAMSSLVGLSGVVTAFCGPVAFLDWQFRTCAAGCSRRPTIGC